MKKQNGKLNFKKLSIYILDNSKMLKIIGGINDDGVDNGETGLTLSTIRCKKGPIDQ